MADPMINVGGTIQCAHGGRGTTVPAGARVRFEGQAALTAADPCVVTGCPVASAPPGPCVRVQWIAPVARVRVEGKPALTRGSLGVSQSASGAPAGRAAVVTGSARVKGA